MFKTKITTLSFEGSDLRCLVVKGKEIKSWRSVALSPEVLSQGIIHDPPAAGKIIQKVLKAVGGKKRNLISCVTDQRLVHRIMTIPEVRDQLLEETVLRKAKQEFAIPVDDTDLSWREIRRGNNQIYLFVLAVPKNIIDQQVSALREAGIKPKELDVKPLAVIRSANRSTGIFVNLEPQSMSVFILVNQIPVIVRSIPLEGSGVSPEARLDLLSQELARTVKFYNESNKKNRLPENTPLFITGKLFNRPELDDRLEEGDSLAERLQASTSYPVQLPQTNFQLPAQFPVAEYAVNLGMASKS